MHVAVIGPSQPRSRHLLQIKPSAKQLRKFRKSEMPSEVPEVGRGEGQANPMWPDPKLEKTIECLRHSEDLRDINKINKSIESAAGVIALDLDADVARVVRAYKSQINRDIARKARVRFDAFSMHAWRKFIRTAPPPDIDIFLYVDGPLQHRGKELHASSMDVFIRRSGSTAFYHRFLPVVSLGRDQLDTVGKTAALLWQLTP
eukprot:5564061-Pyramimonas_sp.AAC.1